MKLFKDTSGIDFPFYNGKPKLSSFDWVIFLIGPILTICTIFGLTYFIPGMEYILTDAFTPVFFCLICLIPTAYVCRGKLQIFFKMPKLSDLKIIIVCFILNSIFTIVMIYLMSVLGFSSNENSAAIAQSIFETKNALLLIQLIGEELFKVSLLICIMALIYNFTENRKISIRLSTICVMFIFGISHLASYNWNWVQCIFIIGLGTIFDLLPYLTTKNLTNSYIVHVLIDIVPELL